MKKAGSKINKGLKKERKMLDTEISYIVLFNHIMDNFLYGLCNGIVIAFVSMFINDVSFKTFMLLLISYLFLKSVESKVFNREKYTSKLGKKYIYPIPSTIGFILGAYLTTLI